MPYDHSFTRAQRIQNIEVSEIVQISENAAKLRAEGKDIVALSTGAPDFPTPAPVIEAAHKAALEGQTSYTPTAGTPALRKAIADTAGVQPENVIVCTGAKQVLSNIMTATLNDGDEVIIPTPYWTTYSDIVAIAGGKAITVPCPMDQGFKISPETLEASITENTKWVMLNSPSNPSGAIYSAKEYKALAEVLKRHPQVWVVSDEIYEHLSYGDFQSFTKAVPELADRTVVVNGVSKAWAMTGWRIGWGIGPVEIIKAMTAVQGQVTSGTCSIAQAAAVEALLGDKAVLAERIEAFKQRRDFIVSALNDIPGFECSTPDGAFYAFPCIEKAIELSGQENDAAFCQWLLKTAHVAIVPGRAFGLPGYARISYAYGQEDLTEGVARIKAAMTGITKS